MFKFKNSFLKKYCLVLILFLISPNVLSINNVIKVSDNSAEDIPQYEIKRYQKDIDLTFKQGTIKIINHYGNVVVKNTTHHTVGLSAVVQEIGREPAFHELKIKNHKKKLIIEIKYPKSDLKNHKKSQSHYPIGRVDLVAFIPIDYKIDVQTTFGKIDFKRVKNKIKSNSTSGQINLSSHYDMEAQSISGQIKAFPMATLWDKGIKLKSKTGTIYAVIPVNAKLELDVKSNGTIKSQLESTSKWTVIENKFKKRYGKEGKPYQIQSKSGAVYLSPHESVK